MVSKFVLLFFTPYFSGEWSNLTHKWSNGLVQPATRRVVLEFNKAGCVYIYIRYICFTCVLFWTTIRLCLGPDLWTLCAPFPPLNLDWCREENTCPNACIYILLRFFCISIVLCPKKKQYNELTFQSIPSFLSFSFLLLEIFPKTHIEPNQSINQRPLEAHEKTQPKGGSRKGTLPIPPAARC